MRNILESIQKEVQSWPFVTAEVNKFGGIEFRLNKRERGIYMVSDSLTYRFQ
jgi:hypothetical protein